MWHMILIVICIVCAFGWLKWYISTAAMIYFMKKTQHRLPNDEEIRECTEFVVRNLLKQDRPET